MTEEAGPRLVQRPLRECPRVNDTADRAAILVRCVCGSLFGLIAGVAMALYVRVPTAVWFMGVVGASVVVCGMSAVYFGDRFWWALRHLKWFPW